MKCKNDKCNVEIAGISRSKTCSDKCRKAVSRQSVTKDCDKQSVTNVSVTSVEKQSVTPDQIQASGKAKFIADIHQAVHAKVTASGKIGGEFAVLDVVTAITPPDSVTIGKTPEDCVTTNRPPCTPDQLTSSCLTCTDKPTCSYLRNQTSAVPGDANYAGVI